MRWICFRINTNNYRGKNTPEVVRRKIIHTLQKNTFQILQFILCHNNWTQIVIATHVIIIFKPALI